MARKYLETYHTHAVKEAQAHYYGTSQTVPPGAETDSFTQEEIDFIASRDTFYMATIAENNWPYVQIRGGPKGFLRVLGLQRLGFLDMRGNRQLISTGNIAVQDRVALILVDYPKRERLKILGHAKVFDARDEPTLLETLQVPNKRVNPERIFTIDVVSYDWNCPKFITPRFTAEEVQEVIHPLNERIADLEKRLAELTQP